MGVLEEQLQQLGNDLEVLGFPVNSQLLKVSLFQIQHFRDPQFPKFTQLFESMYGPLFSQIDGLLTQGLAEENAQREFQCLLQGMLQDQPARIFYTVLAYASHQLGFSYENVN